jgi:hypothetical protein
MKKTLLTVIGTVLAVSAMAQGTLNFGNSTSGVFRNPIYDFNPAAPGVSQTGQSAVGLPTGGTVYGGALLQGANYVAALYAGPAGVTDASLLTFVTSGTFRTATGNVLPGGLINAIFDVPIQGVAAGGVATLEVRVWDIRTGSSFANAATSGRSGLFQSQPLGGIGPAGPVLTPDMTGWSSFSLATVPEPSSFALAGLGAAALMIFRRRKQ